MAQNIRLPFIRPTWADRYGVELTKPQCVYIGLSLLSIIIPASVLHYWLVAHCAVGFLVFCEHKLYCDVHLLWEGLKRLEGSTMTQTFKQATLTPYIKFQNPLVSWVLAKADYVCAQYMFFAWNSMILLSLFYVSSEGIIPLRLLVATPGFIFYRHQPTHDSLYLNLLVFSVTLTVFGWWLPFCIVFIVLWAKVFSCGAPRTWKRQVSAAKTFLINFDYSYLYGKSYQYRLKRFAWIALTWLPLLFCPWFLLGFLTFYGCRIRQKYYMYLVPLAFL